MATFLELVVPLNSLDDCNVSSGCNWVLCTCTGNHIVNRMSQQAMQQATAIHGGLNNKVASWAPATVNAPAASERMPRGVHVTALTAHVGTSPMHASLFPDNPMANVNQSMVAAHHAAAHSDNCARQSHLRCVPQCPSY